MRCIYIVAVVVIIIITSHMIIIIIIGCKYNFDVRILRRRLNYF